MLNFIKNVMKYAGIVLIAANSYAVEPAMDKPVYCTSESEKQIKRLGVEITLSNQMLKLEGMLNDDKSCILLEQKVIVGKKDWETPELESKIKHAILNPSWEPPKKIYEEMEKEYSEGYLKKIFQEKDGVKYMPPGKNNVMGKVKFFFPNKHDVWLHGVREKDKYLFKKKKRKFSHGCIRTEDEVKLLKVINRIVGTKNDCDEKCIDKQLSSGETKKLVFKEAVKLKIK